MPAEPLTNEQAWGVPDVCEHTGKVCERWSGLEKKCSATNGCVKEIENQSANIKNENGK